MKLDNPPSILLIRLSSLGDILLTTPTLRALRRTFPDARIDYLTSQRFRELLQGNPHLNELHLFDDHGDFSALRELAKKLSGRYEVVVDLHTSLRSGYLRRNLKAKTVLTYRKRRLARGILVKYKKNVYGEAFSIPQAYLKALAPLKVSADGQGLEWPQALAQRDAFLHSVELTQLPDPQPMALCPGASYPTKRWPMEYWKELATQLLARGDTLWVFGDQNDREAGEALQKVNPARVRHFCGALSLAEAGAGLSFCRLAVTHDAGPAHMAAAVGVPVVGIFGSTVVEFGFRPYGVPHRIAAIELPCRPCSHLGFNQCPLGHFRCMRDLTVEKVRGLVEELASSPPLAPP